MEPASVAVRGTHTSEGRVAPPATQAGPPDYHTLQRLRMARTLPFHWMRPAITSLLPWLILVHYTRGEWLHWVFCGITRGGQKVVCLATYHHRYGIAQWSPWHGCWATHALNPATHLGRRCVVLHCAFHYAGMPFELKHHTFQLDMASLIPYMHPLPLLTEVDQRGRGLWPMHAEVYGSARWALPNLIIFDRNEDIRTFDDVTAWQQVGRTDIAANSLTHEGFYMLTETF